MVGRRGEVGLNAKVKQSVTLFLSNLSRDGGWRGKVARGRWVFGAHRSRTRRGGFSKPLQSYRTRADKKKFQYAHSGQLSERTGGICNAEQNAQGFATTHYYPVNRAGKQHWERAPIVIGPITVQVGDRVKCELKSGTDASTRGKGR